MKSKERAAMIWGASAGAIPALTKIAATEPGALISGFEFEVFLGHCVIVAVLALLGAFIVRLNNEINPQKAFQLGIMAPAILVGVQSTVNLNESNAALAFAQTQLQEQRMARQQPISESHTDPSQAPEVQPPDEAVSPPSIGAILLDIPVSRLFAQEPAGRGLIREPSAVDAFWRGVTLSARNNWFVIAGTFPTRAAADRAKQVWKQRGWNAVVRNEPARSNGAYAVLIGANLTEVEALRILDEARNAGFRDVYAVRR